MSFTDAFDTRFAQNYFQVHFWAKSGRVMLINHYAGDSTPLITDIRIVDGPAHILRDQTFIVALALCEAATPQGDLFEHDAIDGPVVQIALAGLARTTV